MIFPATLDKLYDMLGFVKKAAVEAGFQENAVHQVEVALEEVLVNIASYAYPDGTQGEVELVCHIDASGDLTIIVKDQGASFDPLTKGLDIDTEASIEERQIGGLGLMMVRQFMDDITYERLGNSNVLTLHKKA